MFRSIRLQLLRAERCTTKRLSRSNDYRLRSAEPDDDTSTRRRNNPSTKLLRVVQHNHASTGNDHQHNHQHHHNRVRFKVPLV